MPTPAPPLAPPAPPSLLTALLDLVDEAFEGATSGAHLLRIVAPPDDSGPLSFGLLDLGDTHPVDALAGFVGDPSWAAAGIVAHGTAVDDSQAGAHARRVRVLHVVARDGTAASVLRHLGTDDAVLRPEDPQGMLPDCCRRVLALPTPPCAQPVTRWWAGCWLDAVRAATLDDPTRPWTSARLASLHPLAGPSTTTVTNLAHSVAAHAATTSWESVRLNAAAGDEPAMHPDLASWMDDGMAARWLLGSIPDPVESVAELLAVLDPDALEPVVAALDQWSIW